MPILILLLGLAMLAGCAKPALDIVEPTPEQRDQARTALDATHLSPPPVTRGAATKERLDRVLSAIRYSTYVVCKDLALAEARCGPTLAAPISYSPARTINAHADLYDRVTVYAGLVEEMGTEAEIAAVVAHELAHVLLGHVQKKVKNAAAGMLVAGGLAGAYGAATRTNPQAHSEDWMRAGMTAGSRAYSPAMEIEADRLAVYILHEAGYPPEAMHDTIVRLHRVKKKRLRGLFKGRVEFLQTHPSNDRRIAHIVAAIRDVKAGVPLKVRPEKQS